jgi:hypothetical protein
MILLNEFSFSALMTVFVIAVLVLGIIFSIELFFLMRISSFKSLMAKIKSESSAKYYGIILLMFIINSLIVYGFLYLRYKLKHPY